MRTNDSSSDRERKISLPICLPSNRRPWRDDGPLGSRQNTTGESLYLRLEEPPSSPYAVIGHCGTAALTLWAVYRAFGYEVRYTDWVGGSSNSQDFYYDTSHVLTDVFMRDYHRYVMQDSTYNISGVVTMDGALIPNSVLDLALVFSDARYSPSVFSDGGYNYNVNPIKSWSVTYPGVDYRAYFHMPASVVPAYLK